MFRVLAFFWIMIPTIAFAQVGKSESAERTLHYHFSLYSQADGKLAPPIDPLKEHLQRLDQRRSSFRTNKAFLHHLFLRTNHTFLKKFTPEASFNELMVTGEYNCLSATALYKLILAYQGFDADLFETNYHTFIIVKTDTGPVMLETTAGNEGFIDDRLAIEKRVESYRQQKPQNVLASAEQYHYSSNYLDSVSAIGVLGLLHYNHAVRAFNMQDFSKATSHLHHAMLLHRSPKMNEFLNLLEETINQSRIVTDLQRQRYIDRLRQMSEKNTVVSRGKN